MTPASSATTYRDWLVTRRVPIASVSVRQLVHETLSFYQAVRCKGLASGEQSDMLLYQWGVYDWGQGEHFEFDLTRQFIEAGKRDDDAISQLRITAYFDPTEECRAIRAGNQWCKAVNEVESLRRFIEGSAAYTLAIQVVPRRVAVEWSPV
jgi:hypothetical protein